MTARRSPAGAACWLCPALNPWRTYALTAGERYGIWGATTPHD